MVRQPVRAFGVPPPVGTLLQTVPIPLPGGFALIALPILGVSFLAYLLVEQVLGAIHPPHA